MNKRERFVVGCMTGTSLDGIDVALTRILGSGLEMSAEFVGLHSQSIPTDLRETLMHLASGGKAEPLVFMRAARAIGELHAEAVEQLLKDHPCDRKDKKPDFIVAHGQTIWHAPRDEGGVPGGGPKSWQLFDPWPVVQRIGVPVCYDLRQADLIAGGEGAPLTPLSDWVMYRGQAAIVYNLGGVGNYTSLIEDFDDIHAEDLYPCNIILDGLSQRLLGEQYDEGGASAIKGEKQQDIMLTVSKAINKALGTHRSLGRELFGSRWLDGLADEVRLMGCTNDILRSAIFDIANMLCSPIYEIDGQEEHDEDYKHVIVLAGGGVRNAALIAEMQSNLDDHDGRLGMQDRYELILSDALGIPCEAREAMGFAVLGALSQDGVPISLPQVTGAKNPGVAGVWAGAGNL